MSKKGENTEALAVRPEAGAIDLPQHLRGGAMIEGDDQVLKLGRVALYQGTMQEQEMYDGCGFKPGDFIDVLEKRKIASSRIVPVGAFITYVNWPKDAAQPLYVERNRANVPHEDLEWHDGQPPAATKCINAIVLVDGEAWPYLYVFKKTGFKAGETIFQLEARRGTAGRGRGCYELTSNATKNPAGQTYRELGYRPVGDCPASLIPLLEQCVAQMANVTRQAEQVQQDEVPV